MSKLESEPPGGKRGGGGEERWPTATWLVMWFVDFNMPRVRESLVALV